MAVNDSVTQNLLPVQAYFNLDGTFNTFIGQNMPFYATTNPIQSGLTITNSTIDSTIIGANSPSTGVFTNITTITGQVTTSPSGNTDITNKLYVDTVAQGLGPKAACQCGTTANITLSGLQTIDGYTTLAGDRVLVKNQTLSQFNGIYIASTTTWSRAVDMDVWAEVPGAYTVVLNGGQAETGWVCTSPTVGTIGVTAITFVQFSTVNTYYAGTGLTLSANTFSITNTGVTANSYGSASNTLLTTVNAQGQLTSLSATPIAIANTQVSGLGTMSTQNSNSVAITGGSINGTTIGGSTAAAITGTTITATSSFSGSGSGLTGTASGLSIGGNAATATFATSAGSASTATTATTATNLAGGASGSLPYQTGSGATTFLSAGSNGQYLTLSSGVPAWTSLPAGVSSFSAGTTGFTPTTATTGAVTLAGTLNIANGGTGNTTGQAASVANAVTFNNSGTGAASGTTFNGFATQTISYNTLGASPLAGSTSLTTLGTVTTGTWNASLIALAYGGTNANLTAVAGGIVYSGASALAITAAGTSGQVLTSAGSGTPTWSTPTAYATVTDDTTTNGTRYPLYANQTSGNLATEYTSSTKLQYNPSTGVFTSTSFSGAGTGLTGTAASLSIGGNAATATSATSATTATNLAGGLAGYLPYQSAVNTTTFLAPGTNGYILTLASGLPTWAAAPATGITITDTTTSVATWYPILSSVTSGSITGADTSSTKLSFVPNTGVLSATSFSGAGTGLTGTASSLSIGGNAATATSATSATSATTATNIANGSANQIHYQTGSGATSFITAPTNNTYLTYTTGGGFAWSTIAGGGTVTSVAQSFTGGIISVSGSPITTSGTLALTVAGTSGGIPYFSSGTTWASSAALTQYGVVYGGGAGNAPVSTAAGTTGQVLVATTSAAPSWSNISSLAITSVLGTTNQITASTTTGAVTLSLPTSITTGQHIANQSISGSATQGAFAYGTLNASDSGIFASYQTSIAGYAYVALQNTSSNAAATTDIALYNDTASLGKYIDIGINSSGFTGTGNFSLANAGYIYTNGGDLALGTYTANGIHFIVNNGATDAMTINSTGVVSLGTALAVGSGGTGIATAPTAGSVVYGASTTAQSYTAAGTSGQVLISGGTGSPTWSTNIAGNAANVTGTVAVANGGTGLTSTPANGTLDIGNGTGFTRTTLTSGNGISITNGSGSITISGVGTTINSKTSAYTLVAGDAGSTISITTGGVTVPNSIMNAGNIVTIYNNSGSSQTITQGTGVTLQFAGQASSTTGNRTLALYGICSILFISASSAVITGSGLT